MIGFIFIVGSVLFLGGAWLTWTQYRMLTAYRPVPAAIQSTDVAAQHDANGAITERPLVRYVYQVGGHFYNSSVVTPFNELRSGGWARGIAATYQPGQVVTAYYDPADPAHAYLKRSWSAIPLVLVVGSTIWLVIGGVLMRSALLASRRHSVARQPRGGYA
jgi:hypothetical protein